MHATIDVVGVLDWFSEFQEEEGLDMDLVNFKEGLDIDLVNFKEIDTNDGWSVVREGALEIVR